jgi:anti-sigma factor RsiW
MRETHERPVCHRAEDLVSYLYGEANEVDARDFHNHLQQCDACRAEFALFNQVHDSIQLWRNEALGASFNPAAIAEQTIESRHFARHERLSALSALREFFTVSPLWLRGATAFAALLLLALAIAMVSRGSRAPVEIANRQNDGKVYTQRELEAEVAKAVDKKVAEITSRQTSLAPTSNTSEKPKHEVNRPSMAANQLPKNQQRRNLNRQEREQLAADLRLTLPADEEELLLALPEQDRPNQ